MSIVEFTVNSEIGKFYIGDISYALKEEARKEWSKLNCADGITNVNDKSFAVYGTMDGEDGSFKGSSGKTYSTDTCTIGIVPFELVDENNKYLPFGRIVEGKELTMKVDENYTFTFYINGKEIENIPTKGEDDENDNDEY